MGVKQQIPSSTNAPKLMKFDKLRGLDCSTSPFEVSPTRAVDMKNIINDDGINHKRQGWSENTEFLAIKDKFPDDSIQNILDLKDGRLLIVFSNRIAVTDTEGNYICDKRAFPGYNVRFYKMESNKVLIIGENGELLDRFLVFDTDTLEIEEKSDYVPTTTISINADSVASTRKSFEEPSLIYNRRINKIISNDKAYKINVEYTGNSDSGCLKKITFTNTKSKSISWEPIKPPYNSHKKKTAVLLEDKYNIDVVLNGGTGVIYTKNSDGVEETITSIDLKEDTTIYVKEA